MKNCLTVGLHIRHKARLQGRLRGVTLTTVADGAGALDYLERVTPDLLVIEEGIADCELFLQRIKALQVPTIYCSEGHRSSDFLKNLIEDYGVKIVLMKPVDPEELVRRASELLSVERVTNSDGQSAVNEMQARLLALWEKFAPSNKATLEKLRARALAALSGQSPNELERREMEREAHKLAGSLGTFGFPKATVLAREIEHHVRPNNAINRIEPELVLEWLRLMAEELERGPQTTGSPSPKSLGKKILLVSEDTELLGLLQGLSSESNPIRIENVASWSRARESWFLEAPDLVIIDLCGELQDERKTLLRILGGRLGTVTVLSLLPRSIWANPDELSDFAGNPVLFHPFDQHLLRSSIEKLLKDERIKRRRLLAVDDDPQILAALEALLSPLRLDLQTLSEPLEFWDTLERCRPELLILDLDMPYLSGLELCRSVRSSPRWCELPILFLSASSDSDTIHRLFSVGADDFVKKPFAGPELVTRILNRLVRSAGPNASEDSRPPLTGGHDLQGLRQVLRQDSWLGRDLTLALISIKNDENLRLNHGNSTLSVLHRRFALRLSDQLQSIGRVTRWRAGEFVILLPGQTLAGAQQILTHVLSESENLKFPLGESLLVTLKPACGLTTLDLNSGNLEHSLRRAQDLLNTAIEDDELMVSGATPPLQNASLGESCCQLLILEPSKKTGEAVARLMTERGFKVRWESEPETAITDLTCSPPKLDPQAIFISSQALSLLEKLGPLTRLINIVVAVSSDDELARAFELGAFDGVEKPCKVPSLIKRPERALDF